METPEYRAYQFQTNQPSTPDNADGIDKGDWAVQKKDAHGNWRNFDGPYKDQGVAEARLQHFRDLAAAEEDQRNRTPDEDLDPSELEDQPEEVAKNRAREALESGAPGHTPGPWHRNIKPATKYTTVWSGRNTHVAYVATQGLSEAEVEANINLISAAPELLAALTELTNRVDMVLYAGYVGSERIAKARAALAKAKPKGK